MSDGTVPAKKKVTKRGRPSAAKTSPEGAADAPHRTVTSYDVAALAEVSQSAVSRCFKPGASVSKKMRERVMKAVDELGYQPNAIARGLITRRSNIVAVIVSNLTVYPEALTAISRELSENGIRVLLFTLTRESDVRDVIMQVLQYQVDGVVAAAHLSESEVDIFRKRAVPLVFFNRVHGNSYTNSVICDQVGGETALVDLLTSRGSHRRFALVTGPDDSPLANQRKEGALSALQSKGVGKVRIVSGDYSYDSGWNAGLQLFKGRSHPDAIICANDMMAFGVLDALRHELGVRVPQEASVVGFDGARPARWASFSLTTFRQPVDQMAAAAASMLLERIDEPGLGPEQRVFPGQLIEGRTHRD